jgi:hypothetical protein
MLVVALSPLSGGGLIIATPQVTQTPATVGDISKGYFVSASPGTGSALTTSFHSYTFTATASDAASTSWSATFDGTTDVLTPVDQWNQPRVGLGYRAAFTAHAASVGMQIKGMGLTVRVSTGVNTSASPAPFMTLSVRP